MTYKRTGPPLQGTVVNTLKAAAHYAADKGATALKVSTKSAIRGAGLRNLANVVDATSSLQKGRTASLNAYGALYSKAGPKSGATGALSIYSEGGNITPGGDAQWLAFPTKAVPRLINGRKATVGAYNDSSLVSSLGPLVFLKRGENRAVWLIQKVEVSRSSGKARPHGKRKSKAYDRVASVVAFIGIRMTTRAKRFDEDELAAAEQSRIGGYAGDYIARQK